MKKLFRVVAICAALFTLTACGTSATTIGNDRCGFVTVSGNSWQDLYEAVNGSSENPNSIIYVDDKSFLLVELSLFDEEDVSEFFSLDDVILSIVEFYWDENFDIDNARSTETTFAGHDAMTLSYEFKDSVTEQDTASQIWAFADENNLYHYVYIEAPTKDFEKLAKEVNETFTLNK